MRVPTFKSPRRLFPTQRWVSWQVWITALLGLLFTAGVHAHAVAEGDKGYIQEISGVQFMPFMYLGAKHMFTGYDGLPAVGIALSCMLSLGPSLTSFTR